MIDLKDLEFFEFTHRYFHKGRQLVSVTEVFERTGLADFSKVKWETMEASKTLGDYCHELARLYALKKLNEKTIDYRLLGYLNGIKKFFKENVRIVIAVELPICDPYHNYAGTPDIIYLNNKNKIALADYKTPERPHPVWPFQTAAYKNAWDKCFPKKKIWERAGVMLTADGEKPERDIHTEPQDFDNFLAALRVAQIKIKNNINT